jgi:predicted nucleic acid-binding protein
VKSKVIIDAGPLVAMIREQDAFREWTREQMKDIQPPLYTCEPVLTEAMFLVRQYTNGRETLLEMLNEGFLVIDFQLGQHKDSILSMVRRYVNVPMSLADACLVRMAELMPQSAVFTLDSDFHIYRKNARYVIPTITPNG